MHFTHKSMTSLDTQWRLYPESAIRLHGSLWVMECVHIIWSSTKLQRLEETNRDVSQTSRQTIQSSTPSSIHPLPSEVFFFFIAAANAAARTETKLALWPPPLPVCWCVCLFSMSPPQPPSPAPSPCSLSNLSLKNFFSSLYNFFFFFCLLTSAPASRGLATAGPESHVISVEAFAWEKKKGSVCHNPFFCPSWGVRGQPDAAPVSSNHKRAEPHLLCHFLLFVCL